MGRVYQIWQTPVYPIERPVTDKDSGRQFILHFAAQK